MARENTGGGNREARVPKQSALGWTGSGESTVMGQERRDRIGRSYGLSNWKQKMQLCTTNKPFNIYASVRGV
jgi:hypothetical protein